MLCVVTKRFNSQPNMYVEFQYLITKICVVSKFKPQPNPFKGKPIYDRELPRTIIKLNVITFLRRKSGDTFDIKLFLSSRKK